MQQTMTTLTDNASLLMLLSDGLARRHRRDGRFIVDPDADLIEQGIVDSQALLDMILDAEQESGLMFDADGIDFEAGVTLRRLAAAFAVPA